MTMKHDFNAELHARPSIYFVGPALVEHIAIMPAAPSRPLPCVIQEQIAGSPDVRTQVEHHTEFVTVTRVIQLASVPETWPELTLTEQETLKIIGLDSGTLVNRLALLVLENGPAELGMTLKAFGLGDTAASEVGNGDARICSNFRVQPDNSSRIILFNAQLNAYRLGRMVRRLCEIETYRAMALLALPEARLLGPMLASYDTQLTALANHNATVGSDGHRALLDDISRLSAQIISAAARTRHRFGATAAYAKIVEERIKELRESHVPGFQRFGIFVDRRFKPAIRTCDATALRLDQLSHATMHLIDLLQTKIQVEVEYQNAVQIKAMAERAAVQLKIQRAVEGFSIIAITYYIIALSKVIIEALEHAGLHLHPMAFLTFIPVALCAVALAIFRVKKALKD